MPAFTPHHYNAIAKVVRENAPWKKLPDDPKDPVCKILIGLCTYFQEQDSRFDAASFFMKCDPNYRPKAAAKSARVRS